MKNLILMRAAMIFSLLKRVLNFMMTRQQKHCKLLKKHRHQILYCRRISMRDFMLQSSNSMNKGKAISFFKSLRKKRRYMNVKLASLCTQKN